MRLAVRLALLFAALFSLRQGILTIVRSMDDGNGRTLSGPTAIRSELGDDPTVGMTVYSVYLHSANAWRLFGKPVPNVDASAPVDSPPKELLELGATGKNSNHGYLSAQFVVPDRLYYVARGDEDTSQSRGSTVGVARWSSGAWRTDERPMYSAPPNEIKWVSVLPPAGQGQDWRMWVVGAYDDRQSAVRYATSRDGLRWTVKPNAVWVGNLETISVQEFGGRLRAWAVQLKKDSNQRELVGFDVDAEGAPIGDPEPVAWQAPELRFGNLAKETIPIVDARAEAIGDGPRHIRLFITYRDSHGKTNITTAENFPVAGERSPTIFARQVKPLVESANAIAESTDNHGAVWPWFLVSGLLGLAAIFPLRKRKASTLEPQDSHAEPAHAANGTGTDNGSN